MMLRLISLIAALLAITAFAVQAAEPVGMVTRINPPAEVTREGRASTLLLQDPVFEGDSLITGDGGRLMVTLTDGTELTLGGDAEMALDRLVLDDQQAGGSLRLVSGAFRFISGSLLKLNPGGTTVQTPVATIGIRGTDFWGGRIEPERFSIFLIDGAVDIFNGGGQVTLDQPGQGTSITAFDAEPVAPSFWDQDRKDRAFATIAFPQ